MLFCWPENCVGKSAAQRRTQKVRLLFIWYKHISHHFTIMAQITAVMSTGWEHTANNQILSFGQLL
jgi:hypothetical protein